MAPDARNIRSRLQDYVRSPEFQSVDEVSLSEYWSHFHDSIDIDITDNVVNVTGTSGIYAPRPSRSIFRKLIDLVRAPGSYGKIVIRKLLRRAWLRAGMEFEMTTMPADRAFDALMSGHPMADVPVCPGRLNYAELARRPGMTPNSAFAREDFARMGGPAAPNSSIYLAYFHMNILRARLNLGAGLSFLEIGAGNGNFAAQLLRHRKGTSYIVDLPRTLTASITFLTGLFPDLKIAMPHEMGSERIKDADLVFLTPAQLDVIPNAALDIAVNLHSFQEMTLEQIRIYFDLIGRVVKPGGCLFTVNRVEKLPASPETHFAGSQADIVRFSEYPWPADWATEIYEICPMGRLMQRDNSFIRLCRKPA